MKGPDIYVIENDSRDWLVREAAGRELGHYPTQGEAETVGAALARKRRSELVIHPKAGGEQRRKPRRGMWSRLFGRA
jgi:Uncharacterized protein conserved in bacteria (DUF2188)